MLLHAGGIGLDNVIQLVVVLLEHLVQEGAVLLLLHVRQDVLDGGGDITGHRVLDAGAAADVGAVDVNLRHVGIRQEVVVGEVRAQQDEQVCFVGGLVGCTIAEQAGHADVEGVVVLDVHLATQGVADGGLDLFGEREDLLAGILHAGAHEERDGLGLVDGLGQRGGLGRIREDDRAAGGNNRGGEGIILGLLRGDIARDNEDGHSLARHGALDGVVQDHGTLVSGVHHLAVARALLEDGLRVGLLEELRADLAGRNVAGQGEDLGAVAVGVVKPLNKVRISRAAGSGAHGKVAGGEGIGLRGKRCGLLVANVNPFDGGLPHCVHDGVEGIADEAVDALHTLGFQGFNKLCGVIACHDLPL